MAKKRIVNILEQKEVYKRFHSLDEVLLEHESFHGGMAQPLEREVFHSGKASLALLYIPETDELLLNEQFRTGAYFADAENPWLIEVAGGIIDEGEGPEETMIREVFEETGSKVLDFEFVNNIYPTPGSIAEEIFLYCARIGKDSKAGIYGEVSEGEEIKTNLYKVSDVIKMLDNGTIKNGLTYSVASWFARHHDRLKQKWS